ncbi:hypothetical protein ZYGR_0I04120 [Zygosaccharomyces rouxii]|uniref:COP9 signalosome complex subunit 5 n=2 Tax=Zygosaccharomyces rouxii TaxID=4956 RepID=C5DTM9_ZYGRC|nr:uncharacterized protein ZYRO0C09856g [Zygosaccharomyces rouxii]KAH9201681.1 JAB1/Mov34/MPN/PAD-1 ubiquitin protease-domain-containing protein [Zygosaccharomyces rouxii]GAV48115.1 hypothetical protein ZYGR_0I04120 [Zygosaccharomyces rouxii]CAR27140.1 ZYRO0C09856p [Zygosaccharomyces rouxii]
MPLKDETVSSLRKRIQENYMPDDDLLQKSYETNHSDESLTQGELLRRIGKGGASGTSRNENPWSNNPRFFSSVSISRLACLKALEHALRGGNIEVMGMLIGTTMNDQFVIFDIFELPVEGTETRVNAQTESYEYMVQYVDEMLPANQNIVGWYHSHPGYDCWLSSIDMHTQQLNQNFQDPYVAIVIDPHKSIKERKLCIGAFRTIQEPGVQQDDELLEFYELKTSIFESRFDSSLGSSKLKIDTPKSDSLSDILLIRRLFDTMKQWNTFNEMITEPQLDDKGNVEFDRANPLVTGGKEQVMRRSRQMDLSRRRSRSNSVLSVTSNENESDVDMDNKQLGDVDSVSSSIHTMTDPAIPVRRQTQTPLPTFRKIWPNALETNYHPATDETIRDIDDEGQALHTETLRADYITNKRDLLGSKLKEYQQLRFFRDTFTSRTNL